MQQMQPDNEFWHYAVKIYGKPGVAEKLLHLQDNFALDINLLLLMHWLGNQGRLMDNTALHECIKLAEDWQQAVIRPLRSARRALRERRGDDALYRQAKTLELAVEQQVIAALYQQIQALTLAGCGRDCIRDNIDLYIKQILPDAALPELAPWLDFAE